MTATIERLSVDDIVDRLMELGVEEVELIFDSDIKTLENKEGLGMIKPIFISPI